MLYKILYSDNTIFNGESIENSLWAKITKPIKELHYTLFGKTLFLYGYESYNHLIFKPTILGKNYLIIGSLVIAKEKNIYHCFSFDIRKKTIKHYISQDIKKFQPPQMTGWKIGIPSEKPSFTIL